jgi:hypothetical protein
MTMSRVPGMGARRWQKCDEPDELLLWLSEDESRTSQRKNTLLGLACLRRVEDVLDDPRTSALLDVLERYADGAATREELSEARKAAAAADGERGGRGDAWGMAYRALNEFYLSVPFTTCQYAAAAYAERLCSPEKPWHRINAEEGAFQCHLLRDVFGDPFRPGRIEPTWRTPDVLALAGAVYQEKAFDRLPILADALEEAGCTDARVRKHCRGEGVHVKGCWVVDLVLGKS